MSRHRPATVDVGLRGGYPSAAGGPSLVRAINEQVIVDAVLTAGRITRSELARRTGLSRPTVSSLMQTLETHGIVTADGIDAAGVGRPATVYRVNRLAGHAFAVDLGGTKLRAAVTDVVGEVIAERAVPTPQNDLETLVSTIVDLYQQLVAETEATGGVAAACIGIPGVVQEGGHHIESAFNLPPLGEADIPTEIGRRTGLPVIVENDVNLAAVGERWKGAGRDTDSFVAISIGTGIGMGIVVDGELYRGGRGAAGEIGFLPIGADPFDPDILDHGGPLESAAAARGIRRRVLELAADHPSTGLDESSTVREIFAAAESGDSLAGAVISDEARIIAMAIGGITAVLDPRLVVLGGGIGANPLLADPVREHLTHLVPNPPRVETSTLGERASLEGAVALALHRIRGELLGPVEVISTRGDQ